jgi:arylsulfatase A-like enzyme
MGNLATVMAAAGRDPVYKGKFHVTKYTGSKWVTSDVGQYGFTRWNPQDAGANQTIPEEGAGMVGNDDRFMYIDGSVEAGMEGVFAYLRKATVAHQPFCLIVSLVNPHDVLFYPKNFTAAGYDDTWLPGDIVPPGSVNEDLTSKPRIQSEFIRQTAAGLGAITNPQMQRDYLNFYGNLMKLADSYLVEVLDMLDLLKLTDNTLVIRTSDHGEMGLSHGGARQKCFNFYEQTLNVPLIYSNPKLYPVPAVSSALVSHVDFLPTLASLFDTPAAARSAWQGVDYSSIVLDPSAVPVQDYLVFTYDDYQCGQPTPSLPPPNHIVSIREERYKLAEYYDANGHIPSEWEMYDLATDPDELDNLACPSVMRITEQQLAYERLTAKLRVVQQTRLQPLS